MNGSHKPLSPLILFMVPILLGISVQSFAPKKVQRFSILPAGKAGIDQNTSAVDQKLTNEESKPGQPKVNDPPQISDEKTKQDAVTIDSNNKGKAVIEKRVETKPALLPAGKLKKK